MGLMNIVVCVSGGIAAYKSVSLVRLFVEAGHRVHVVPTEHALQFVGAATWEAISGHPVAHDVFTSTDEVLHVRLGQEADAVVVAPATAHTMAKMVAGLADNLLGTTLLATRAPVYIAPAMHTEMWEHPSTQHNVAVLRQRGVTLIGPESGRLTGSDSGLGRMSEPQQIFERVSRELASAHSSTSQRARAASPLAGKRVVISTGGTREPIDPVRFIGNRSSGKQGVALAAAAASLGADVELVCANVDASVVSEAALPMGVRLTPVSTTAELETAMNSAAVDADLIVMAAAVADFRPVEVEAKKIRKAELQGAAPSIELVENPDILAGLVRNRVPGQLIVGFAAETAADDAQLLALGREKLRRKGVDFLVVNAVGWAQGFEQADNAVIMLDADEHVVTRAEGTKREVADAVVGEVASALGA
jgi:phosphopantothenoylcysteine decarboxylase/phosphopantothenate--cysteine ligase